MNISFRYAEPRDAVAIVPFLRERDLANLIRQGNPPRVIQTAMTNSISCFIGEAKGQIGVMWGLQAAQLLDDSAYLWMLGTTLIDKHPIYFLRYSRAAVRMMCDRYRLLYGEIEVDYEVSQRWLAWMGARIVMHERRLMFVIDKPLARGYGTGNSAGYDRAERDHGGSRVDTAR